MVTNKEASREFILENKLNTVKTSGILSLEESYDYCCTMIHKFIKENPDIIYYGIRENKPSGLFTHCVYYSDVFNTACKIYLGKRFTICESMFFHDRDNLLIQGDFYLTKDFILSCGYSTVKGRSLRESSRDFPHKIWELDLKQRHCLDSKLNRIVDYLVKNNLFNVYVELTMYSTKVGVNKENILVWEVRDY